MKHWLLILVFSILAGDIAAQRSRTNFNYQWKFFPGDDTAARQRNFNDSRWRKLDLPHDWSIEGEFSEKHPTTFHQGALPAGIGWYRKSFTLPSSLRDKKVYIIFDGIYRNSEVWINGHYLGKRANGYISFRYDITPYLKYSYEDNVIAVRVDNSLQPSSRWYTGSGIYRNVWLETTNRIAISDHGLFVTTPQVSKSKATVNIRAAINNESGRKKDGMSIHSFVYDNSGKLVTDRKLAFQFGEEGMAGPSQNLVIDRPQLWSVQSPSLYRLVTKIYEKKKLVDEVETIFGIRYFSFDPQKGFSLNGQPLKILGVCNHHDLGALGAAVNTRAIERQLEILKAMGCNAIRTAHNPPAPELLDLCDRMGFLVMDEAFDMWKKRKNRFDYNIDFDQWHRRDLEDMVARDRNHPSVFMWSIGNEIREQFDSTGLRITRELVDIVKAMDTTRPVICALTENFPEKNFIYRSGALDVLGFNYKPEAYGELPARFPGNTFIATETASALATRGHYDLPSDSNRKWPPDSKPWTGGNPDHTVSAYDHVYAYWGASHEDAWKAVKKYDHIAGCFVWSGFDFLGEPVPYQWPSRSSYYGIIDIAGFPKDVYYMYQSEWTKDPVLHIFPHWNWKEGQTVDIWSYYNNADEVELFLNGTSLGKKAKGGDSLHVIWKVPFEPGVLKAVSRQKGKTVLTREVRTAGAPYAVQLSADRTSLNADGNDLSFVTVKIVDKDGNLVPDAGHLVSFTTKGPGFIAGVDNGDPVSHESFKASQRRSFHGLCLAIVQSTRKGGEVVLTASADGLLPSSVIIRTR